MKDNNEMLQRSIDLLEAEKHPDEYDAVKSSAYIKTVKIYEMLLQLLKQDTDNE